MSNEATIPSREIIIEAIDWCLIASTQRHVELRSYPGGVSVWIYDFSLGTGAYIVDHIPDLAAQARQNKINRIEQLKKELQEKE